MPLVWGDLFANGSIVDLDIKQWSGRLKIHPSDFGIDSEAVNKAMSLGHHHLVPKGTFDAIQQIVTRAKKTVDRYGVSFSFIRGARFIPDKNLATLIDKLEGLQSLFTVAVDDLILSYASYIETMRPIIRQALIDATTTGVIDAAVDRINSSYPSAEDVRNGFGMRWAVFAVQSPTTQAIKSNIGEVRDVLKNMVTEMRTEISTKVGEVLAVIAKGGKLQKRSVTSAKAALDRVDSINVFGDDVLNDQVTMLRKILDNIDPKNKVSPETIVGLEGIKSLLGQDIESAVSAAELALTGLGQRKIEVP